MVNMVEAAFDVAFDDPEVFVLGRDTAATGTDAVHRTATRTKALRAVQKVALPDWFEREFEDHLDHPIFHSRNAKRSAGAVGFGYPLGADRLGLILAATEFRRGGLDRVSLG